MLGVVAQIDGFDPLLAQPVALRAASHDDPAVCHVDGGDPWWPALIKLPTLRYDLFHGAFGGDITAPSSSLTLASEPWPNLGRYALADARIRLWTGDVGAAWATWTLRFDGRVSEQPELADGAATINFAVDDRWLDAALLTTYAGTTGAEGTEALKGQPKPLALGAPRYVAGTLIDNIDTVFQLSAYGPLRGFEAALERLARFGESVGDFASYAALVAATVPAGRWATAEAVGMVRLGAPPTGQVSFLIGGDQSGPDGWARLPGAIIRRLALLSGGAGRINDASLDALDVARPYNQSIYVDQQTTARQLIQQIAASVNAVAGMSWTGQLFVVPVGIGAPGLTLAADGSALPPVGSVKQIGIASPFQKLAIGAARAWTVHALSDIAFTATLVDLGTYVEGTTYREGNIVSLADGSRWLFISTAAAAGHAPPVGTDGDDYWANLSGPIAGTPAWDDVTDPNGTKPADNADVTGDNKSADTGAVGGRPAPLVLATLDKIEPITLDVSDIKRANVDQDALLRQADRDRAALAAAQIAGLLDQQVTRITLRDAGIITDPDTGKVYIYAVEQNAQKVSKVEIGLDAVTNQIALRATYDDVATMITQAQLSPGDAAEFGELVRRVNAAEISLSGMTAAIALKADAITVTQLGGIVQSVSQNLDALAGLVTTKVSYSDFNPVRDRIGSVEQLLQSYGDVSTYQLTLRQAELRNTAAAVAGIAGLVTNTDTAQRLIVRSAEIQQQLTVRMDQGDAAEAASRLALAAKVSANEAGLVEERSTRADAVSAQARRTDLLTTTVVNLGTTYDARFVSQAKAISDGDKAQADKTDILTATVTQLGKDVSATFAQQAKAISDGDQASATALTQVSARIGDFGLISVQQAFSAIADRTGKLEGQYTLAISTDGRLQGFKLAGSASGPASFSFIDTDLNMGTGRIIYNTGVVMQVQGIGFGRDGDLLEWFGPSMPVNSCTRANATSYKTTSGSEYMGGSLSAGFRTNAVRATMIAANADVTTGPFESAGRPRTVTVSLLFSTNVSNTGTCPAGPVTPSVTVELYRGTSAAGVILSSRTIVGGYSCEPGRPNDPGSIVEQISGSFTYTDNSGGNTSSYYVRLTNRTTNTTPDQQVLSLLSVEE